MPLRNNTANGGSSPASCSGFFVHGWAKAWTKIAFGNYMEAMERSRGRVEYGPNYRAYWAKLQTKARKRLNDAALRSGATLKFGTFNSVEIHIPNVKVVAPATGSASPIHGKGFSWGFNLQLAAG